MEKTVILLHGFGEDRHIFDGILPDLTKECRVLVPDLPGSGALAQHQWLPEEQNIEWLADWVAGYLQRHHVEKAILLGHSMGGYITLAFAEKFSDRLIGFGLLHSTAFADSEAKKITRGKAIDFMRKKGGFSFLKTAIPGLFAETNTHQNTETISQLTEKAKTFETTTLIAYYEAMRHRPDRTSVLKNTALPVLMIAGGEDNAVPLKDLLQQASLPAVCHFFHLKNVGHMGMLEDPQAFRSALVSFITTF